MERSQLEAHVDATAAALGLPLAPEHRAGVHAAFASLAADAALVMAQPLRLDDDAAPLFTPIASGDAPVPAKKRLR
jgi:hypothetical protein